MKPIFIAEIKTQSPFGFKSEHSFGKLMDCAIEHGDWISVHDNVLWGGDFEAISFVRRYTTKPIIAKGLHTTDDDVKRALDHGADYVLIVNRFPAEKYFNQSLLELDLNTATIISKENDRYFRYLKYVCNSRDLRTGQVNTSKIQDYLDLGVWACQASGIKHKDDVNLKANAFIVGEHLIEFCNSL